MTHLDVNQMLLACSSNGTPFTQKVKLWNFSMVEDFMIITKSIMVSLILLFIFTVKENKIYLSIQYNSQNFM